MTVEWGNYQGFLAKLCQIMSAMVHGSDLCYDSVYHQVIKHGLLENPLFSLMIFTFQVPFS